MLIPKIREVRAFIVRGGGADYHEQASGHWIDGLLSRAYLRQSFQAGEMIFSTLATSLNLKHYLDTMRRIRRAILAGEFPALLDSPRTVC